MIFNDDQMVLFIGDFVRLVGDDTWLEVTDIRSDGMTVVLENDHEVVALSENISEAVSYLEMDNINMETAA
ncbi:MAG: hypothetical protein ACKVJK_21300 [Methylophagaceae bacterium]|mgnify:FL=1|jgi:hypothetical protein|tara:strand:- start:2444 stop:2656 length:213 start_codon:yes stop_codon:yes gene_type:complete